MLHPCSPVTTLGSGSIGVVDGQTRGDEQNAADDADENVAAEVEKAESDHLCPGDWRSREQEEPGSFANAEAGKSNWKQGAKADERDAPQECRRG